MVAWLEGGEVEVSESEVGHSSVGHDRFAALICLQLDEAIVIASRMPSIHISASSLELHRSSMVFPRSFITKPCCSADRFVNPEKLGIVLSNA